MVHLRNGRYGLVEIKLGGDRLIAEGVATLEKLAGKIDTDRMPEPAFKMVLTGTGKYAYRRKDGHLHRAGRLPQGLMVRRSGGCCSIST